MRRLPVLLTVLLVLVFQGFGAVVSSWTCEGKMCSTDTAVCCCSALAPARDATCRSSRGVGKACAGKCSCKLTVKSVRPVQAFHAVQKASSQAPTALDVPVVLPPLVALPGALIVEYVPVLANPPPAAQRAPLLEGAPLRAPPVPLD